MGDSQGITSMNQGILPPKLVGASNYANWSSRLRFYLMGQDLWSIVTGDMRPKPVEGAKDGADARKHVSYISQADFRQKD